MKNSYSSYIVKLKEFSNQIKSTRTNMLYGLNVTLHITTMIIYSSYDWSLWYVLLTKRDIRI